MRLDEYYNLLQIKLNRSYNPIMPWIDLGTSSSVRLVYKLTKFLTKTSCKMHELKTYNEAIDSSILGNR